MLLGFVIAVIAGVTTGSFALPMKFTTKWKWENTWSMWTVWTLMVVPWVIGFLAIPDLVEVYRQVGWKPVTVVFFFGFIWGFSAIAFGTGVDYLGLGLGYSLMMGMIIAIGAILPLMVTVDTSKLIDSTGSTMIADALRIHPEKITDPSSLIIIAGVAVIILGVVLNACAAVMKEKDLTHSAASEQSTEKKSFLKGVIICCVAGVTAPMLNYSLIAGGYLTETAEELGTNAMLAPCAIWPIALSAGFLTNLLYCVWLVQKNKGWNLYLARGTKRYYLYTLIMGVLWAGSIAIFGIATTRLGKLGPSIGWAVFNSVGIFWANILGLLTREWKGVRKNTVWVMTIGLLLLLVGICIVGWANYASKG